ncbi:MAG: M1 family metallopeptidase, partial [Vicinamibacteria bacterium]
MGATLIARRAGKYVETRAMTKRMRHAGIDVFATPMVAPYNQQPRGGLMRSLWLLFLLLPPDSEGEALSPRNANYRIEVELDPETKTLTGKETITWRNIQPIEASDLRIHLYWNAWRNNRSTWLKEARLRRSGRNLEDPREGDWSYSDVESIRLIPDVGVPGIDLTSQVRFAAPDDGNPEDRTLLVVPLPEPVPPEGAAQVELTWKSRIPRTFARTGYRGNFFFVAQWFPKLAVLEENGWNAHQFHAGTEFFSDYGEYDVSITVPSDYVVGATGRETDRKDASGKTTYRYQQADVHDFAWTASPDYLVFERRFESPGLPPVDMRLLLQPEHLGQKERHFDATAAALENYGKWYGAYPYGHVTVVDPAYGSGAGGMEYPTFFTAGTRLFNPFGGGSPEGVTVHECGHQFWYGLVGNNEFEHAWLDEGFNTFSTARTMDVTYGPRSYVKRYLNPREADRLTGFLPVMFDDIRLDRVIGGDRLDDFREDATWDAQSTPTFRYFPATGGALSYDKTSLWLHTLERYLGWETLQRVMSTFFERWKFKHPT